MEESQVDILVLGVGNLLLQDEGAGVRALDEFARKYESPAGVELLDGGTSGIELLQYILGRDRLIILDVVKCGTPPGTVVRLEGEEVPALFMSKISPHQLGISDLLAVTKLLGKMPGEVVLLGIEPKIMDTGFDLSDEVSRNLGKLVDMIAHELTACGLDVPLKAAVSLPASFPPPLLPTSFSTACSSLAGC
jgi:hydrogenase maturation protease